MNTTKRFTKRDHFNALRAYVEGIDVTEINGISTDKIIEFIEHELELLDRKNASGEKKPTAQQIANESLRDVVVDTLRANGSMMTITELQKACPELGELTNQRISALIRPLLGITIERIEDKRKAYFKAI